MINDNPVTYLILAVILVVVIFAVLNSYATEHPQPKDYGIIQTTRYPKRTWEDPAKKRRFY